MQNRIFILLSLSFVLLTTGCYEHYTVETQREISQDVIQPRITPPSPPDTQPIETASITEPNGVLTLRDVLALTLMHNPELKIFSLETRAADARTIQAGLRPNPELAIDVEDVGGSGARSGFDAAQTTIQLSQLIELGDKRQKRKTVASLEKDLSGWDYESKRLEVLTQAGKSYFELLAMQNRAKLLSELVDVSKQALAGVGRRVEAGKDSPLEQTKASVALSTVQIEYQQALQELENARKKAASFWGNEQPRFTQAEGHLETVADIPDIDHLRQLLLQNPRLARWEKEIARSKAAVKLENSKAIPDISIGGGFRRFNETDDNAVVFGVSIPLPIFDRNQGGRMEATVNLSKAYEEQRAVRVEIINQFNQIFTELSTSLIKIKELQASILPAARDVFNASQIAYTEGKIDYLNVLDAQRTYFVTQTEYIETLVSYHTAKTDMEGLIGQRMDAITTIN